MIFEFDIFMCNGYMELRPTGAIEVYTPLLECIIDVFLYVKKEGKKTQQGVPNS